MLAEPVLPEMYTTIAAWFHLLSAPEEYEEEAAIFTRLFQEHARGDLQSMLELGSGGGNNASHMKRTFALTLSDLSPGMLEVSRAINPELEHVEADMRTLRLGRTFDAVFVHDAIDYMLSEDDLRAAIQTAYEHLRPGGIAIFVPDATRESFMEATLAGGGHDSGGRDGPDGRGLRYLEWRYDPDPGDTTHLMDYVYILREPGQRSRVIHDVHVCGLFSTRTWLRLFADVGFDAFATHEEHSEVPEGIQVFVALRPE